MAKNFNYKKLKAVSDSRKQRVSDMRSGGSGNLRSSIFNRTDEAITNEMVDEFWNEFDQLWDFDCKGGEWENSGKQVMKFMVQIPSEVKMGNVNALLAKVNYDKDDKVFYALYRPKNGKWSQAKGTGVKLGKKK